MRIYWRVGCEICGARVKDIIAHRRRSESCKAKADVLKVRRQGWGFVLGEVPSGAPVARECSVWERHRWYTSEIVHRWRGDERLAYGPVWVVGGGMGPVRVQFGVLARVEEEFDRRLCEALEGYVIAKMIEDGGRIPFSHRTLRGYGTVRRLKLYTLQSWAKDRCVDAMIQRYVPYFRPIRAVSDYIQDKRIKCPQCKLRVMPKGMRAHRQSVYCVWHTLREQERILVGAFQGEDLTGHPLWQALRDLGMDVQLTAFRHRGQKHYYVSVAGEDLPMLKRLRRVLFPLVPVSAQVGPVSASVRSPTWPKDREPEEPRMWPILPTSDEWHRRWHHESQAEHLDAVLEVVQSLGEMGIAVAAALDEASAGHSGQEAGYEVAGNRMP